MTTFVDVEFIDENSLHHYITHSTDLTEVSFTGGIAAASSTYSGLNAPNAFVPPDGSAYEETKHLWAAVNPVLPAFIWYDFQRRSICPSKVSFLPRQDNLEWAIRNMATKYQFLGSNDETCNPQSSWTLLCEDLSGKKIKSFDESRGCEVVNARSWGVQNKYRCISLKILELGQYQNGAMANVYNIRVWEQC